MTTKKNPEPNRNMKLSDYLILAGIGTLKEPFENLLEELPRPKQVCGKAVPETLDDLTFGQLIRLQGIKKVQDLFTVPFEVVLNLNENQVMEEKAVNALSFCGWVLREVKRINKLFESTNAKPTSEELMAGAEKLSFGPFGLIDYYALRMGIDDHDKVLDVPWVRIYKCMDIDAKKQKYERKLREIYAKK